MKAANALKRERRHSIARYYHGENTNVLTTDCMLHMLSILCSICSDLGYLVLGDKQTEDDRSCWRYLCLGGLRRCQFQNIQKTRVRKFVFSCQWVAAWVLQGDCQCLSKPGFERWASELVDLFSGGQKRDNSKGRQRNHRGFFIYIYMHRYGYR